MAGGNPRRPNWKDAADAVAAEGGVRIVVAGEGAGDPLTFYLPERLGAQGSPSGDAIYRARLLSVVTECARDLQAMLPAQATDCEWEHTHPGWLPDDFQPTSERHFGNVMVRSFEAPRPTAVDVTHAVTSPGYAAFILPRPETQGTIRVEN
jgi:hypothetical protein